MKSFKDLIRPRILLASALLAVASAFGANTLIQSTVSAAQCNPNDIVDCGVSTKQALVSAYNNSGEIQNIYRGSDFGGLQDNDRDRFLAGDGYGATAYKDGRLVLDDGRTVATNSYSLGRLSGGNPYNINIAGKNYHWGYNSTAFGGNSIRAWVLMDRENKYMQFAALTECGNPITGTKPVFQCDHLRKEQKNDTTYEFWTEATAKTGASVKNVIYNFGDGTAPVTKTNPAEKVSHTYSKAGNYHVTVTVTYTVNGKDQSEKLQVNCQTDVTVKEKKVVAKCDNLQKFLIDGTRKYKFVGNATFENASLTSATLDFGDGQTAPGTIKNTGSTKAEITAEHQYANELVGKKTITLALSFTVKDGTTSETCKVDLEFKEKTCKDEPNRPECQPPKECKPGIPEGDDRCKEILPKEIAKTGPAEMIGSAIGLSSLAGAGAYYRASRKNLLNIFKR